MADFTEARTRFTAKDKVSKSFRDMDRGAARFGRTAKRSFRDASAGASRFRDVTKGILTAGVVQRGFAAISTGIGSVTRQFIDFDKATIGAAARFKDIGPEAANFEQQLGLIRDRAREAGATTEFTAAQSAEALNFLAKAGFTSAEAFGVLASMIDLATATGEDFATVADFSSDLLGAFGLNVDDTAQKVKNLARLNDVLVKAANTANVTVEDLFETMKIAAPIATGLGQSLESVTAVTAFLGGAGIKGGQSATALKNSFLNLASPTTKASKMLKELGVRVDDGTGNMRQLNDIIGDLAPELDKMGNIKAAKILNEIFGKRAIAGAINIGKGTEAIKEFQKSLDNAGGTAAATAERMRKALGNRLLALGSAATEFGFKILEAFEVKGEGAIDKLTAAVRKFNPEPIIFGIGLAVDIIKNLWTVLKPFTPFMPWFIGMWIAYAAITKALAIGQMVSGFLQFWLAIQKVSGSMAILNAVMTANPVGAVIVGVALLIAALIWLVKNFDKVKEAWSGMIKFMEPLFFAFVNIISTLWLGLVKGFLNGFKLISGFLGGDVSGIDTALAKIDDFQDSIRSRIQIEGDRVPPNQEEAAARRDIGFEGRINIAGAPAGSTVESKTTGAPDIEFGLLG